MVKASPSISISRLMVLSSFVAMGYAVVPGSKTAVRCRRVGGSFRLLSSSEHIVDEPLSLLLTNDGLTDHSALLQHVVSRLENALQM